MKKNSKRYTNELGSMPLALMVTVLIISLSGIALSVLAFQSKTQTIRTSKWENSTAMMSGMAFAAEQVGSQAAPKTAAQCQLMFPSRPPKPNEAGYLESWRKNTDTSTAADTDINTGQRRELGLFRWWVDCDQQLLSAGKIVARVEVSNVAYSTRTDPIPLKQSLISSKSWNNYPLGNITSNVNGPPTTWARYNTATNPHQNFMTQGISPYGDVNARIWEARPIPYVVDTVASGGGLGSVTPQVPIDSTKKYRWSVWVKRNAVTAGSGIFYMGIGATGTPGDTSTNGVFYINTGGTTTNPYNLQTSNTGSPLIPGEWALAVGYIWPADTPMGTATAPQAGLTSLETGLWSKNGIQIGSTRPGGGLTGRDLVWKPETRTVSVGAFLYRPAISDVTMQFFDPRLEVVDGTEPSIDDLLRGPPVSLPILDAQKVVFENGQYAYSTSTTPSDKE